MHDIKLTKDWTNEAGQVFKQGVMLRVSLLVAHKLVGEHVATPMRGALPQLEIKDAAGLVVTVVRGDGTYQGLPPPWAKSAPAPSADPQPEPPTT